MLPLLFTVFNASPLQLLWVAFPRRHGAAARDVGRYGDATLLARAVLVVAWQVAGWWIVVACLRASRRTGGRCRAGRRARRSAVRLVAPLSSTAPRWRLAHDGDRATSDAAARLSDRRACSRGCCCCDRERELAEEGVGFGVPVLKRGVQTVFPGGVACSPRARRPRAGEVTAAFEMDLVERLAAAAARAA